MPYKRNPMRAERVCGLARHVIALSFDTAMTAATQWLERSLDDSSNRRLSIPEAFLACDGILVLLENVFSGLVVHADAARRRLEAEIPFLATENVLMEAVPAHKATGRKYGARADHMRPGRRNIKRIDLRPLVLAEIGRIERVRCLKP